MYALHIREGSTICMPNKHWPMLQKVITDPLFDGIRHSENKYVT